MEPYYRPTQPEDITELAPRLRECDVKEVKASNGVTPLQALQFCATSKECNSIIHENRIIGMFGCADMGDGVGSPWLLGSDEIPDIKEHFLPQSKEWVERMQDQYKVLINYIDARNSYAFKWLKFLGFEFTKDVPDYGYEKRTFIEFMRTR